MSTVPSSDFFLLKREISVWKNDGPKSPTKSQTDSSATEW